MVCLRSIKTPQVPKGGISVLEQYAIVPFVAQVQRSVPSVAQAEKRTCSKKEECAECSEQYAKKFARFLEPLLRELYERVDKRRLGTLVRHEKWKAQQIDELLLERAEQQLEQWEANGEDGLLIWDGTVLEKPESLKAEGLCAVRSSKAGRLTHVKKGYYHPPGAPIFVPGMHGIGLLLASRSAKQGPAMLAALRWWTSRGPLASYEKDENCKLLREVQSALGTPGPARL